MASYSKKHNKYRFLGVGKGRPERHDFSANEENAEKAAYTTKTLMRELALMKKLRGLGGVDVDLNIIDKELDIDGQEIVPRNYDRAFAIKGVDGIVYQKGEVYILVRNRKEAEVIHPSEDQLPKTYAATFANFVIKKGPKDRN